MLRRRPNLEKLDRRGDVARLSEAALPARKDLVTDLEGARVDVGADRRIDAVRRLAGHDGDDATAGIRATLRDPEPAVRLAAVEALGARGCPVDETLLDAMLTIDDEAERAAGAQQLEAVVDDGARREVLESYAHHGAAPELTLPDAWVAQVAEPLGQSGRSALVQSVAAALLDEEAGPRVWQVVSLDAHNAARALAPALTDHDHRLRALGQLSRLRSAAVLDEVVALTRDEDLAVRRAAVTTLGEIRHPRGVEALLHATIDDDYDVRDAAMTALDRFGTAGSVWGMATMARGVIADAGGWPAAALGEPAEPAAIPEATPGPPPQLPSASAPQRRRRWRRS